ncbi:hypothetical protein EJ08DRAFT_703028 [Tothia fuscella]|uniref:Uncharacterized protein n=1 Tax=Tothia fuscella TaxID=1048955 RepID=A0A9P4TT84_9PEZI|nr:hypothetical protein EJ08DRAFT_703028 [Tothia fuscella]
MDLYGKKRLFRLVIEDFDLNTTDSFSERAVPYAVKDVFGNKLQELGGSWEESPSLVGHVIQFLRAVPRQVEVHWGHSRIPSESPIHSEKDVWDWSLRSIDDAIAEDLFKPQRNPDTGDWWVVTDGRHTKKELEDGHLETMKGSRDYRLRYGP